MEKELKNLKTLLEQKNINYINIDNNKAMNEEELKKILNNFINEFKLENAKLSAYNETKNSLIENTIKKEFDTHITNIKNIFEENMSVNSKPYKIIEYLNSKMEELYGYKTKAERYQSQTELLLNEQKILKEQVNVYRKIASESKQMAEFNKENLDKYKLNENMYKDAIKKAKKYIKKHFSVGVQNELFKLLEVN